MTIGSEVAKSHTPVTPDQVRGPLRARRAVHPIIVKNLIA